MRINLAVSGATGRMGRALAALIAESTDLRLVGGIARSTYDPAHTVGFGYDRIEEPETAGRILASADVVIDFSSPEQLVRLLDSQRETLAGRALVVGTTGLSATETSRLEDVAQRSPVLTAANFSVGVNLLLALAEAAARALPASAFDVEIVEAHHRRKEDAPSGTALALGRAVASARGERFEDRRRDGRSGRSGVRPAGEIGFHALRGGDIVGEHRLFFLGERERLELAHVAGDRYLFAEGALLATRWIRGKQPGFYTMREVLGLRL